MADRKSQAELLAIAADALPPVGTSVSYQAWRDKASAVDPKAGDMYRLLKAQGMVKASLTQNEDGTIVHNIERVS